MKKFEMALDKIMEQEGKEWYEVYDAEFFEEKMADELGMTVEELKNDIDFQEYDELLADEL